MKKAPRVAATVVAAAAVGIGLAGPAAATTHAKPGPSATTSSAQRAPTTSRGGGLFERVEVAVEKALGCDEEPP